MSEATRIKLDPNALSSATRAFYTTLCEAELGRPALEALGIAVFNRREWADICPPDPAVARVAQLGLARAVASALREYLKATPIGVTHIPDPATPNSAPMALVPDSVIPNREA